MTNNESKPRTETTGDERRVGQFNWKETSPNAAILSTVASAAGCEEQELDVLYESVDPDAVETLFRDGTEGIELSFLFAGYRVTVRGDGTVFVEPDK